MTYSGVFQASTTGLALLNPSVDLKHLLGPFYNAKSMEGLVQGLIDDVKNIAQMDCDSVLPSHLK
jgi:hypothetical protein